MTVTNPLSGEQREPVRRDGRSGGGEAPPHGHGRPGADADVHAVRAGRLLPQRVVDDAVREQRPVELRVPAEHGTDPNQTFAWNHGGIQPEIASTVDRLGRAGHREEARDRQGLDRPHRRPADDARAARAEGRLRVRRPRRHRVPEGRRRRRRRSTAQDGRGARRRLYKQINASFGQFSMDTLCASTGALASNTPGDTTYTNTENALAALGDRARRARRTDPRWRSGTPSSTTRRSTRSRRRTGSSRANDLLDQAARARGAVHRRARTRRSSRRSSTSSSSTRRTTASTTCTAAGRA